MISYKEKTLAPEMDKQEVGGPGPLDSVQRRTPQATGSRNARGWQTQDKCQRPSPTGPGKEDLTPCEIGDIEDLPEQLLSFRAIKERDWKQKRTRDSKQLARRKFAHRRNASARHKQPRTARGKQPRQRFKPTPLVVNDTEKEAKILVQARRPRYEFDATLGYPGEGPGSKPKSKIPTLRRKVPAPKVKIPSLLRVNAAACALWKSCASVSHYHKRVREPKSGGNRGFTEREARRQAQEGNLRVSTLPDPVFCLLDVATCEREHYHNLAKSNPDFKPGHAEALIDKMIGDKEAKRKKDEAIANRSLQQRLEDGAARLDKDAATMALMGIDVKDIESCLLEEEHTTGIELQPLPDLAEGEHDCNLTEKHVPGNSEAVVIAGQEEEGVVVVQPPEEEEVDEEDEEGTEAHSPGSDDELPWQRFGALPKGPDPWGELQSGWDGERNKLQSQLLRDQQVINDKLPPAQQLQPAPVPRRGDEIVVQPEPRAAPELEPLLAANPPVPEPPPREPRHRVPIHHFPTASYPESW